MKKIFLVGALALFGAMNAQTGLKIGAHVGLPVGDASKVSTFNVGADVSYLYPVTEQFRVGATTGYSHFFGKEVKTPSSVSALGITIDGLPQVSVKKSLDYGIIPVAASAEYDIAENFFLGADLGYAVSTIKDAEGAFYYQPKVGYKLSNVDLTLSYKGMSQKEVNLGTVSLGAAYRF